MNENLIFDGNTIYELDADCMQKRKRMEEQDNGENCRSQEYIDGGGEDWRKTALFFLFFLWWKRERRQR